MRVGAAACAAVLLGEVVLLVAVDPPPRCPAWILPKEQVSVWFLVAIVSLWAAWIGFWAIRWDWAAQLTVDRFARDERLAQRETQPGLMQALTNLRINRARARVKYARIIDFSWLLIAIMLFSVFVCALPLLLVVGNCF